MSEIAQQVQDQTIDETYPARGNLNSDTIKWMITGDEIAEGIEVELTGRKLYNGKLIIVNPFKKRMINDDGINSIKIIVTSNIGKGVVNSNLTEDEILRIADDIWRDVTDKLYCHWSEWGVNETDCSTIRAVVVNNCYYSLKRAKDGTELSIWGKAVKRTEVGGNPNRKQGTGFLGWLGLK